MLVAGATHLVASARGRDRSVLRRLMRTYFCFWLAARRTPGLTLGWDNRSDRPGRGWALPGGLSPMAAHMVSPLVCLSLWPSLFTAGSWWFASCPSSFSRPERGHQPFARTGGLSLWGWVALFFPAPCRFSVIPWFSTAACRKRPRSLLGPLARDSFLCFLCI